MYNIGFFVGGPREYVLDSTDTLTVGWYILTVTEVGTGSKGYGRFSVGASECLINAIGSIFVYCMYHAKQYSILLHVM